MDAISALYPHAVERTKNKVLEDINRYFEEKEEIPSYEEYLRERGDYIDQIWVNVWLNKVTNDISRNEKKDFLREKDYEVDGVDRKLINHLFRNEMREYEPFQVMEWLDDSFLGKQEKWEQLYKEARANFYNRKEVEFLNGKRKDIVKEIIQASEEIVEKEGLHIYLYVRSFAARQLTQDLKQNTKFQKVDTFALEEKLVEEGSFNSSEFLKISDFFDELTGNIHKTMHWGRNYFEYETYYFVYEKLIADYLSDLLPRIILEQLDINLIKEYEDLYNEILNEGVLKHLIQNSQYELMLDMIALINEEYVDHLLKLSSIPFDPTLHKEIYEKDIVERERRIAEELAEIERKKEEEARMMESIFGHEYRPSAEGSTSYVLHIGDTNTGKTFHALERMKQAKSGLYLAPLRLLALEVYDKLNSEGIPCSLKTGEEEKMIPGATHIACTVEMFHEKDFYDVVVIDEAQMISDKDRGFSWYKAITKSHANEVHIIGSRNIKSMMLQLLGDSHVLMNEYRRDIPLQVESKPFQIKDTKNGDALVCFSRARVLETASKLQNDGHSVSMIYGSMPPETRKKQMLSFIKGETKVIVSTDAIGMGLNLPIRRIVFLENEKFDGTRRRRLRSQEVKQIAGRAGRKGLYNVGKVAFTKEIKEMQKLLLKDDEHISTFAIAPTNGVFERFQKYYRNLGTFFELWNKFESPKGTAKSTLSEERELYEIIEGTEIEARLSMMDLYGFLHLPFSKKEPELTNQWKRTMVAIINGNELPEPNIKTETLEELELSYKSIGLHLLFLYKLGLSTEAVYWERIRESISDGVNDQLKTEVRNLKKKCKSCGKNLPWDYPFQICDSCFSARNRKRRDHQYHTRR